MKLASHMGKPNKALKRTASCRLPWFVRQQSMHWLYLTIAIVSEVIATSALKATEGFTRWVPSLVVVVGYAVAFYFLSLTLRAIPIGVAYAVWSGVGVVLVTVIGWYVYHQPLDLAAIVGIALIVAGVVVLNAFSKVVAH
jgi:small multidrug resistance pump